MTTDGTLVAHYEYDRNRNRQSVTRPGTGTVSGTYDAQDRVTSYGALTYSYNVNGDLQTVTSGSETTRYSYDVFGNLTAVSLPNGAQIDYVIDGQNRRIGKKVNGVLTQGFLYGDQLRPVAELDGTGSVVSRFVYGTKVNVPEYMIKAGVTYRLLTDHLGSVRLVVDTSTGAIAQRLDYDEFGQITQDTNPGFQPFGFVGGLYDPDTKLTRFGARDYDAFTGRWTAKDPILFQGRNTNLFGYLSNDPLSSVDPFGLEGQNCDAECPGGIWRGRGVTAGGVIGHLGFWSITALGPGLFCVGNPSLTAPYVQRSVFVGVGAGGGLSYELIQVVNAPSRQDLYTTRTDQVQTSFTAFGGVGAFSGVGPGVSVSASGSGFQTGFGAGAGAGVGVSFSRTSPY